MVPGVTQDLLPEGFQLRRVPQRLMIGQCLVPGSVEGLK